MKIVQRVPVKIVIDKGPDPNHPLPLGLSVEPKVTVEWKCERKLASGQQSLAGCQHGNAGGVSWKFWTPPSLTSRCRTSPGRCHPATMNPPVLTSYLVANGIVLPISAFSAACLGARQFFLICIVMFTICSFLCGIATELWQIILFRVLQGFFGGGLQLVQQSVLLDYFKPEDRGKAFGLSSIAIIVAPVIGPTLGGWITDNYSWRWVFFINIPVGILTVLAIHQLLEDPPWSAGEGPAESTISVSA